jgi:glyoxylase-like metal-dependent hydrolase (beta-lactamase superfamily II)
MTAIRAEDVTRIHYGYIVAPEGDEDEGQPRPVSGFLIRHRDGLFLFDTGMSPMDEETRERYHPRATMPDEALRALGVATTDVGAIANCHMHADHAGGNSYFPGIRILVQAPELAAAREPDFTYPLYAFDYPDARLDVIDGETDVGPGLRLLPTPGHTPGHQSLLVETDAGRLLLAGQATNTASQFSAIEFAERLVSEGLDTIGTYPEWMAHFRDWKVDRAYFAHDLVVWERDPASLGRPQLM